MGYNNGVLGQGWKSTVDLNLQGNLQIEWDNFISCLNHCGFQVNLDDDYLIWSWNEETRKVTTKLDYDSIVFFYFKFSTELVVFFLLEMTRSFKDKIILLADAGK